MAKVKTDDIFNLSEGESDNHGSDSEGGSGYDSEEQQKVQARKKVTTKKTKKTTKNTVVFGLDDQDNSNASDDEDDYSSQDGDDDEEEDNNDNDNDNDTDKPFAVSSDPRFQLNNNNDNHQKPSSNDDKDTTSTTTASGEKKERVRPKKQKIKTLTPEALEKFQKSREKTGIVYISKIPPFMKPIKLRHLLGQFGELGRVYLAPEDPKVAARRKKYGGNKKQNYTEGWVEFMDKSIAKQVAHSLNTTVIGGKKNSHYHDDMWNIKYLPKFKWHHLTERIAYENASRAQRLQAEISQAKRENKFILTNMEKSKMIKNMEEKKEAKRKAGDMSSSDTNPKAATAKITSSFSSSTSSSTNTTTGAVSGGGGGGVRRAFKQRKLGGEETARKAPVEGKIKSVLGSIFGR
ncbi:RNA-binding ATPase activator esf2 [Podila humilis]|nr:RNA-binding ATPase activator esf2 [Podila humilis]